MRVLELCQQAGLVKLGYVALDGGKVRAHATRHKAMSYGRMKEKEGQLAAEVAELLRRAGEVDDDEDRRYGKDKRGDELPEEIQCAGRDAGMATVAVVLVVHIPPHCLPDDLGKDVCRHRGGRQSIAWS